MGSDHGLFEKLLHIDYESVRGVLVGAADATTCAFNPLNSLTTCVQTCNNGECPILLGPADRHEMMIDFSSRASRMILATSSNTMHTHASGVESHRVTRRAVSV